MPRASSASLTVIGRNGVETVRRPPAPAELDAEEQQVWRDVVNGLPAEWFPPETHGLLIQYCRLFISARHISELKKAIEKVKKGQKFDLVNFRRLTRDEAVVSQALGVLARNMRLSQGSTSRQEYVRKRPMTLNDRNPWDRDDDEEE